MAWESSGRMNVDPGVTSIVFVARDSVLRSALIHSCDQRSLIVSEVRHRQNTNKSTDTDISSQSLLNLNCVTGSPSIGPIREKRTPFCLDIRTKRHVPRILVYFFRLVWRNSNYPCLLSIRPLLRVSEPKYRADFAPAIAANWIANWTANAIVSVSYLFERAGVVQW